MARESGDYGSVFFASTHDFLLLFVYKFHHCCVDQSFRAGNGWGDDEYTSGICISIFRNCIEF